MTADTWEARMAERTRARKEKRREVETTLTNPPGWLNGNHQLSDAQTLWIWPAQYCICCGATKGLCTFVMTEDYVPPPMPDWPFTYEDCPICQRGSTGSWFVSSTD